METVYAIIPREREVKLGRGTTDYLRLDASSLVMEVVKERNRGLVLSSVFADLAPFSLITSEIELLLHISLLKNMIYCITLAFFDAITHYFFF